MPACFLTETEKVVDLNGRGGGKELGDVGGGETVVRIYYIKKIYFQEKKKNKEKLDLLSKYFICTLLLSYK